MDRDSTTRLSPGATNSLSAVKTKLNESQSKLSLEMATTVDLRKQIEDLRKEMAERSAKLEQEVQDWKDKEAKTKEAGEKKYEREKEKGAKVVASKDEQLGKLRDTVKNGKMQIQELRDQSKKND